MKIFKPYEGKEEKLQIMTATYMNLKHSDVLAFHTPNGGGRSKRDAGIFKISGVKAGIPDWVICAHATLAWENYKEEPLNGEFCGLVIELKTKGNYPKPHQREMIARFAEEGWATKVCWSVDEFMHYVDEYLKHRV